mgnify:CR=1 FL=1
MRETRQVSRINIGTASIVLILIILCLSVFSLLSLSDARSSLSFAERRAQSVQAFYSADAQVQRWLSDIQGLSIQEAAARRESLPEDASVEASGEEGILTLTIPMSQGQSLLARYSVSEGRLSPPASTTVKITPSTPAFLVWTGQSDEKADGTQAD